MGYLVEQYREGYKGDLIESLYKAKMEICKAIEELEEDTMERMNYRMNKRSSHRGRYDY